MPVIKINRLGEIPNIGDYNKIKSKYLPIISEVKNFYIKEFGINILGLYIRGSISSGQDNNFSDFDFVAITKKEISKKYQTKLISFTDNIQDKYKHINGFELATVSLLNLTKSKDFFNLRLNLKTCSVLIYGEDVREKLPKVIPGKELSVEMFEYTLNEYKNLSKYFISSFEKSYLGKVRPVEFWCSWIMRVLSRSGIGVFMINEKIYSNDIRYISKKMTKKYPEFKLFFEQASKWVINPVANKKEVNLFLKRYVKVYFLFWEKILK